MAYNDTPDGRWDVTDLNGLIRQEMNARRLADPNALMPYILAAIPPEFYRDALAVTLREHIMRVIRGTRSDRLKGYRTYATLRERYQLQEARPGSNNPNFAATLHLLAPAMEERISVEGQWKFLGDCTVHDLRAIADWYRQVAQRNLEKAAMYEELAAHLLMSGAERLAEMVTPDPVSPDPEPTPVRRSIRERLFVR